MSESASELHVWPSFQLPSVRVLCACVSGHAHARWKTTSRVRSLLHQVGSGSADSWSHGLERCHCPRRRSGISQRLVTASATTDCLCSEVCSDPGRSHLLHSGWCGHRHSLMPSQLPSLNVCTDNCFLCSGADLVMTEAGFLDVLTSSAFVL